MGGHGAWEMATHYPDRAHCIAAAAGWISKVKSQRERERERERSN